MNGEEMEELKEGWKKVKLGEILNFYNGKKKIDTNYNGKYNIYGASGIIGKSTEYLFEGESIILGRVGAYCGITFYERDKIWSTDNTIVAKTKTKANNLKYFYYLLKYLNLNKRASGSAQPLINQKLLSNIEVEIPALFTQKKIVSILSLLDEKIELNRKINQNLEEAAQTLFKRWFIDFEFPNEEGKPYKSSGGKMIESELGEIPEGWRVGKLGEIIEIFDSLRKPLSKKERDLKEKLYPYYGAAGIIDYVDEYSFDGEYILLGEDGTVVSEKGTPILNFIQEKFWVSNHAHVISEKNKDNSYLYYLLKNTDIRHIITGAVQPKINQKNLIELKVTISQEELVKKFSNIISNITLKIRNNQKEIKKLTELRDYLLPRLMSGEISV